MPDKVNILVAYPYFSDGIRRFLSERDPSTFRLIIDSGAFTAWNTGATITMDGYTSFLRSIPKDWDWRAVQLDVYGNPEATYNNWRTMLDDGWENIMPVFTRGDTLERLEEYYSVTDYIMFGGIAFGGDNRSYIKWFSEANKGRKVHWLGFTSIDFIKHYRPESVDSSSIMSTQRFGTLSYYAGGGKLANLDKKVFSSRPPQDFISESLKRGFTMGELKLLGRSEAWKGNVLKPNPEKLRGFASFVNYTHHVWRAIQVERQLGTKMYLAFATDVNLTGAFHAYDFMRERGVL